MLFEMTSVPGVFFILLHYPFSVPCLFSHFKKHDLLLGSALKDSGFCLSGWLNQCE